MNFSGGRFPPTSAPGTGKLRSSVCGPRPVLLSGPRAFLGQRGLDPPSFVLSRPWGSDWRKHKMQNSCRQPSGIACYHFFSISGPLLPGGPPGALRVCVLLASCCLLAAACLLDTQAPPQWSTSLINRLKYYVVQLGDPNQDWVLGPS